MPVNAGPKYFLAEKKYLAARTKEEKIAALQEMITALPKHKGSEHLLAQLKKRLANLKSEKYSKSSAKPKFSIKKEGAAQVCIIGLTQAGKSTLINSLTNANAEVGDHPFTTKNPIVGMMDYGDLQIQLIEIPSMFDPEHIGLLHTSDLIIVLVDSTAENKEMEDILKILRENNLISKKIIFVHNKSKSHTSKLIAIDAKSRIGLEKLKEGIWNALNLIRVYTKSPRKQKDFPAIALKQGSTVKDVAKHIHKDFLKTFKFARVFNDSKFSGQKVGLDYILNDLDVVEIHTG